MIRNSTALDLDELGERITPDVTSALINTAGFAGTALYSPNVTNALINTAPLSFITPQTQPTSPGSTPTVGITTVPTATTPYYSGYHAHSTTTTGSTTTTNPHALAGRGSGAYSNPVNMSSLSADQLTTYNFNGTANLAQMGAVKVTGTIHAVGFVFSGQATGKLTFTTSKGSVTVQLTGAIQQGFSPLPEHFSYKVVSHTGSAYAALADSGTLTLNLTPNAVNFQPQAQGGFTLKI
jgi:hypothetical protein